MKKRPQPRPGRHRTQVLDRFHPSRVTSRQELARATGLSATTIFHVTKDLVRAGILKEVRPARSRVGRPSPGLQVNGGYRSVLGIGLMDQDARILEMNLQGELLSETIQPLEWRRGPDGILGPLRDAVRKTLKKAPDGRPPLAAAGLALSGQWDRQRGVSLTYPRVPDWKDVPLRKLLEEWTEVPATLSGYASTLAVAEYSRRVRDIPRNLLCVEVEDTVAMGVIMNGEVLEGSSGSVGELGHITVDPNGPACYCGNTGCLETLATCATVVDEFQRNRGRTSSAPAYRDVVERARAGDAFAVRLFGRMAATLGIGLATAVNLFNPDLIILNGSFFDADELVMAPLRTSVQNRALPNTFRQVTIERSRLGAQAPARGAGLEAIRALLHKL